MVGGTRYQSSYLYHTFTIAVIHDKQVNVVSVVSELCVTK